MGEPRRWKIWTCPNCGEWDSLSWKCACGTNPQVVKVIEAAPVEDELEHLRGLLMEAVHYLDSCGCDDEDCPGRQKAKQIREALGEPSDA